MREIFLSLYVVHCAYIKQSDKSFNGQENVTRGEAFLRYPNKFASFMTHECVTVRRVYLSGHLAKSVMKVMCPYLKIKVGDIIIAHLYKPQLQCKTCVIDIHCFLFASISELEV